MDTFVAIEQREQKLLLLVNAHVAILDKCPLHKSD